MISGDIAGINTEDQSIDRANVRTAQNTCIGLVIQKSVVVHTFPHNIPSASESLSTPTPQISIQIMSENSSSLSSLCNFVRTDVGATLMGKTIRVDESGVLLSVKDAITVIEGITSKAGQSKMQRLIKDNVISEGTTAGFKKFKIGTYM